jgi:hypothetical protein
MHISGCGNQELVDRVESRICKMVEKESLVLCG